MVFHCYLSLRDGKWGMFQGSTIAVFFEITDIHCTGGHPTLSWLPRSNACGNSACETKQEIPLYLSPAAPPKLMGKIQVFGPPANKKPLKKRR